MKRYTIYLGCMIPMRFPSIEKSARLVFKKLGVELIDLEGYTCCPDPVLTRLSDDDFSLALSARNLALAGKLGNDLLVLCNGCYETLYEAGRLLEDPDVRMRINRILEPEGLEYTGKVRVRAFIDVMAQDFTPQEIEAHLKYPRKLKAACHTGCHMLRGQQHPRERVKLLEKLVDSSGAQHTAYGRELDCCSFPCSTADEESALKTILEPKLAAVRGAGAEIIVTGCPTCLYQLETGQVGLRKLGSDFDIPVFHLLELMALAFGADPEILGLELHRGRTQALAREKWGDADE